MANQHGISSFSSVLRRHRRRVELQGSLHMKVEMDPSFLLDASESMVSRWCFSRLADPSGCSSIFASKSGVHAVTQLGRLTRFPRIVFTAHLITCTHSDSDTDRVTSKPCLHNTPTQSLCSIKCGLHNPILICPFYQACRGHLAYPNQLSGYMAWSAVHKLIAPNPLLFHLISRSGPRSNLERPSARHAARMRSDGPCLVALTKGNCNGIEYLCTRDVCKFSVDRFLYYLCVVSWRIWT